MAYLKGIFPSMCMHWILLEDGHKPSIEPHRRLNPTMKEVVRKEALKWLDAGVIYPISDSSWVTLVQVVPEKGGTTMIKTENNALLPSRIVTGWRICIDYRKLNKATRNNHFPLSFMDQMLDKLAGHEYYYCHAPDPGPTRLANPNRFRGANPYTGTPFFFLFFSFQAELISVVYK